MPLNSYHRSLLYLIVVVVLLQTVVVWMGDLSRPPWGDESHFVATVRLFGQGMTLDTIRHYPEMSTPLPFMLYSVWGQLVGFELPALRILSLLIALLSYLLFHRLLFIVLCDGTVAFLATAFLAVHPYMVGFSIFVFTDGLAIMLVITALLAVVRGRPLLLFLSLAGALLCRQYMVYFVLACLGYYTAIAFRRKDTRAVIMAAVSLLSMLPLIGLFLFWGGFTPDSPLRARYLDTGLYFHPSYLVLYIALLSVYLLPVLIARWRELYSRRSVLICLVISAAYFLAPVAPSKYAVAIDVHTVGLFHKLLVRVNDAGWFSQAVFYPAFLLALPLLWFVVRDLWRRLRDNSLALPLLLDLVILLFLIVMPFSYLNWEKYLMPLLPAAILRLAMIGRPARFTA